MKFRELSEVEFAGAVFSCDNFLQSVEMYQRHKAMEKEAYLVGVEDEKGEIVAKGLLLARNWRLKKKIFRVPGGFVLDYDKESYAAVVKFITQEAKVFCKNRGGIVLEVSPNIISQPRDLNNKVIQGKGHLAVKKIFVQLGYKYLGEYEQAKWIMTLDLRGKTAEGLLQNFRTTHRQLIRKAEREGVRVRELGENELDILKEIAAEAGERHGFKDPEIDYYLSMKNAFRDKVKFVVAEAPRELIKDLPENDKREFIPLAASMFVNDGREMVYLYSGSLRSLQRYNGSYLIQWEMIKEAIKLGLERYNFYGTKPVEGNGVYLFKQGFRGQIEELLGTFALSLDGLGKLYVKRLKTREMGDVR